MGTRSRLFASAAFPLLSISLMLQPASAALLRNPPAAVSDTASNRAGAFEVAQEQAPDGGQDDQDPRKHKKHGAEGQPGEPQQQEQQKQPAAEAKPEAKPEPQPEPKPAPKAEAPKAEPAPEPKPAPAAQPEAQPEPPKPQKQEAKPEAPPAPAPAAEPVPAPEAKKPHKAAEQPAQPDAQQPKAAAEQPAAPVVPVEPPAKKAKQAEQPAAQEQKQAAPEPAAPKAESAPAPAQQDEQPANKKHKKPDDKAAEPAQQPAEQVAPAPAAKPAEAKPEEAKQPPKPQDEQQPAAAQEKPPAAKPADGAAPAGTTPSAAKPAEAGKALAPADASTAGTAPAAAQAPAASGEQVSPAELERRKKIAENPAAATGPVILPVQNGAAVLDSDKDAARRAHRQGGDGQPGLAPGGQRPAGPAQGGQAQGGQSPAGQNGQAQGGQRPPEPANVKPPTSDADAQRGQGGTQAPPVKIEAVTREQGRRMDQRPDFAPPQGAAVEGRQDNRVIMNFGDDVFVRHDDTQRFTRDGERPTYEQLSRDRYRETIARPDGTRIVTVRNRYGDIIQRSSIDPRGREYVLFYAPELEEQPDQDYYRDPGDDLPPMRLRIPLNQYIIDTSNDRNQDYYDFLREPPVERVERVYSLNEVRYSARIRDKVRRIDLDTITFATGSADIPMTQAKTLRGIADAIGKIIKKDPSETFLIEGHTDAVGSAQSNLILSDQRAESVANLLTDVYGIPPENLATQGYGEQYLKVDTRGPEQENRRVTIRRVTALVRPVASRQ